MQMHSDFNDLGRYDMIMRLEKANRREEEKPEGFGAFAVVVVAAISVVAGIVLMAAIHACELKPAVVKAECAGCHNRQMSFAQYFRNRGSESPHEMAYAVLNTKSPRLLAAISVVESGGNPAVRRTGYKKRHDGAYQINPRHWGSVPYDALSQTRQAERILAELTEAMPIKKALSVYGGDSTDKYARTILSELQRVP